MLPAAANAPTPELGMLTPVEYEFRHATTVRDPSKPTARNTGHTCRHEEGP